MSIIPLPTTAGQELQDFVLWLNGATSMVGDTPPTQEQWDMIRGEVAKHVGQLVAQRLNGAPAYPVGPVPRETVYGPSVPGMWVGTKAGTALDDEGTRQVLELQNLGRVVSKTDPLTGVTSLI